MQLKKNPYIKGKQKRLRNLNPNRNSIKKALITELTKLQKNLRKAYKHEDKEKLALRIKEAKKQLTTFIKR